MKIFCGTDIIEISRIQEALEKYEEKLVSVNRRFALIRSVFAQAERTFVGISCEHTVE